MENSNKFDILKDIRETYPNTFKNNLSVDNFLKKYNISTMDPESANNALGELHQEHDQIIIPEEIGVSLTAIVGKYNWVTDGYEINASGRRRRTVRKQDIVYSDNVSWRE